MVVEDYAAVYSLSDLCLDTRVKSKGTLGMTALGSLAYYDGPETKAREDAVELMAMRIWDRDYCNEYVRFLADPQMSEVRAAIGVATLARSSAVPMIGLLDRAVALG